MRSVEPAVPDGSFALVFCVYNSFIGVLSQPDQLAAGYLPTAELDLVAQLAGLHLEQRWSTWNRRPVTGAGNTISVYRRQAT